MSEHFLDQDVPGTPSSAAQEPDVEDEEEEEIDELVSEPEIEPPSRETRSPSPIERNTGTSLLPVPKMEEILLTNALPNMLALSKEALFLVSTATEEFIKKMTRSGLIKASAERRSTVSYSDMSYVTQQYQEFMFLQELIPAPISLAEALELRQEKERELTAQDPALTIRENVKPASSPPPSAVVRQLPPVPSAASNAPVSRPSRTKAKTTKPKTQPAADPNGAAPHPDRSGVPQHMQHQMQMQVNGDFAIPGGVSMQVDMTDASTISRSSSRSTKSKRKEPKAQAPAKRRKTALETSTTATPASSVGTSPPVSRSRSASTSASVPPSNYSGNHPPSVHHPPSLDYIADRPLSNSSSSSRKKKDASSASVPSHLLDPALTNGNPYPDPAAGMRAPPQDPPHNPTASNQWPAGNPYPNAQPLGMNGGAVGRTIYSTSPRSASTQH